MVAMDVIRSRRSARSHAFLSIPPFPRRRYDGFVLSAIAGNLSDETLDELAELIREARVGGCYWGAQPVPGDFPDHLGPDDLATLGADVDPWHLLSAAREISCDPGGDHYLIAGLLGVPVRRPGSAAPARPLGRQELRPLLKAALGGFLMCDPFGDEPMSWSEVIALCRQWRELIDANREIAAIYGFAGWKRATTEPLLWGGSDKQRFDRDPAELTAGQAVAVWRSRTAPAVLSELEASGVRLIEVEDGFIRSAGLGANCVPPQSIVVDPIGIYFDGRTPSRLEQLLQSGRFTPDLLDRFDSLQRRITTLGLTKYDSGHQRLDRRSPKPHVLVPAQVEDDRAVLSIDGPPLTNLELLRRVRAARPDAYVLFKPHPDVEAGHRKGVVPEAVALQFADEIVREGSIASWIDLVDEVHVNSSLAGFEALVRGKAVVTYGVPFYAGWGLTTDLGSIPPRRTARRSLGELSAATLLLYPRYVDPVTNLPCSAEVAVARLAHGTRQGSIGASALVLARRIVGWLKRRLHRNDPV
ncbi:capsular polysaccharide export protein, LipB/KpsS family [Sphingomonas glaciei]|uniref:Capsular polysaccharide biosynthesis protein n=1 Tax=Sphingomonas glaciei TaxID=2938948 RepID=A0ABY5MXN5_9SPHN|nr:hypothetical protein [Sphingomonas glaciei]UUR08102.1 hypothetical protein M1K48_00165 [Sphingomonas glaciei]